MNYELVDITTDDLTMIFNWRNQHHIRQVMYNSEIIRWEDHLKWYEKLANNPTKISKIFKVNNEPFGILNINNIDLELGQCEWGFYVGANNSPKGTGLLLGYASINYIFTNFKMSKIHAEVLHSNQISQKFHQRLGFSLDKIVQEHIKRNGTLEDVYVYSLLHQDWLKIEHIIQQAIQSKFEGRH